MTNDWTLAGAKSHLSSAACQDWWAGVREVVEQQGKEGRAGEQRGPLVLTRTCRARLPLLLVSVKRLERTRKPIVSPPAGVHEGLVTVSLDSEPGMGLPSSSLLLCCLVLYAQHCLARGRGCMPCV